MNSLRYTFFACVLAISTAVPTAIAASAKASDIISEGLVLDWPETEGWRLASNQSNKAAQKVEWLREGETFADWTQIGSMIWQKNVQVKDIRSVYDNYLESSKKTCPDAHLEILLIEPAAEFPRVIFLQECSKTSADGHPEAGLWLAIQGKQSLYIARRAVRQEHLPEELRDKWVQWLKTGQIIQR